MKYRLLWILWYGKVFSVDGNGWWNMNCERELITPAVAATAPLTITKYNVTIDKRNVWKGLCFITTEYSWKQGNFLIDNFSVASNVSACFMPWMGHILVDMKFRYKISLQHLERIIFLSYVWVLGSKQYTAS